MPARWAGWMRCAYSNGGWWWLGVVVVGGGLYPRVKSCTLAAQPNRATPPTPTHPPTNQSTHMTTHLPAKAGAILRHHLHCCCLHARPGGEGPCRWELVKQMQ